MIQGGFAGRILHVDLTRGQIRTEPLDADLATRFVGGLGLSARLAYDAITPGTDPLSPENPIVFEWAAYHQAVAYWVDLARGEEQQVIWQSSLIQATSLAFDGTVGNGAHIQPGEHWWGVGARRELGSYMLTVYGYLPGLIIEP